MDAHERDRAARQALAADPWDVIRTRRVGRPPTPRPPRMGKVTPAELDALRYLSHGLTEQMTADALGKSFETVKGQTAAARRKLAAKNTCHACAKAVRLGLID